MIAMQQRRLPSFRLLMLESPVREIVLRKNAKGTVK